MNKQFVNWYRTNKHLSLALQLLVFGLSSCSRKPPSLTTPSFSAVSACSSLAYLMYRFPIMCSPMLSATRIALEQHHDSSRRFSRSNRSLSDIEFKLLPWLTEVLRGALEVVDHHCGVIGQLASFLMAIWVRTLAWVAIRQSCRVEAVVSKVKGAASQAQEVNS